MNKAVYGHHPGVVTIAEESTSWPKVSQPVHEGGLGFGFKWNMGFMHDTLEYMAHEPIHRKHHHSDITFGLLYAFSENFVLPLSHDEVVHGKGTLLSKMAGDDWQKFANLRAYYGFMWGYPGKKLLFMGQEFAQRSEWSEARALDWHLLDHAPHRGVRQLVRDLNYLYRSRPALHARDCEPDGFSWLIVDDSKNSVFAWLRKAPDGHPIAVISNFTPVPARLLSRAAAVGRALARDHQHRRRRLWRVGQGQWRLGRSRRWRRRRRLQRCCCRRCRRSCLNSFRLAHDPARSCAKTGLEPATTDLTCSTDLGG